MESSGIKFKIAYQSLLLIIDLPFIITVETLGKIIKEQLKIDEDVITIKWTDDEEDACTISSQIELDEAKRIFGISKMEYLVVNGILTVIIQVFKGDPLYIGGPCSGEENLYRNGAKRWRQIYCYNSHVFHRKRYNKICFCVVCNDVIWGIGRQGVRCCGCKLFVHKKCCHKVLVSCQQLKMTGSKISADDSNLSSHNFKPQETIEIVYRDLKLDNVLLDWEGHVKLTDFGMCKENVSLYSRASTFCGTPNYIAPEVLKSENYGFQLNSINSGYSVDWWALGVLAFEMLAGRSPFDVALASQNVELQTEEFLFQMILERDIKVPRFLSVKTGDFILQLLKKDPTERLACKRNIEFNEFKSHPFFKGFDWKDIEKKKLKPPFSPKLENDMDHNNFDPVFTSEPIQLTPDDPLSLNDFNQSEFDGFEYINPAAYLNIQDIS
ncbi:hypothetical protein HZS_6079 [Henneguya salminicola]|nr:hypothetical protein HZS_6079 [Henneguya salminicola]